MDDKNFEKMDQDWMKSTKELREKKVSEGMLKGFAVSVERRLEAQKEVPKPVRALTWVPAMALLVIAFVLAVPSPRMFFPGFLAPQTLDYAQLQETENLDEEIAALKEVGAWSEADDALLGENAELEIEDLELSNLGGAPADIA